MDEKTLKYIATYLMSFLGGFFIPGIVLFISGNFESIQGNAIILMVVSAIVGLLIALLFTTILKTDIYLSTSSFLYGYLGAMCGILGFACGTLVILALGAA